MKRFLVVILVVSFLSATAAAQEASQNTPQAEWYLGYSYVRVNSASFVPAFSANGGGSSFVYNFSKSVGIVGDFGGYHNGKIGPLALDNTTYTYLFGPRFSYRKSKITPYFQAMLGGAHVAASIQNPLQVNPLPPGAAVQRVSVNRNSFALGAGGGFDVRVNKHFAIRPIQIEYLYTQIGNQGTTGGSQNNLRYSAGVVLKFGNRYAF